MRRQPRQRSAVRPQSRQRRRHQTTRPRSQRFHRRTRPFQRPRRLPLHARAFSLHGAVAIAVEAVSLPRSGGCSVVVVSKFEFDFGRIVVADGTAAAEETKPFACPIQVPHSPRRGRRRGRERQRRRKTEESAVQVENRRPVPLFAGGVSFPVSGAVQVHRSQERGGWPSAAAAASSHFLRRRRRETVPRSRRRVRQ